MHECTVRSFGEWSNIKPRLLDFSDTSICSPLLIKLKLFSIVDRKFLGPNTNALDLFGFNGDIIAGYH